MGDGQAFTPLLAGNVTPRWTGQGTRLPFHGASRLSDYTRLETINEGTYGSVPPAAPRPPCVRP